VEEEIYRQLAEVEERHWWFRGRRRVIWSLLAGAGVPRPARVLDAGCGTGRNLVEFGVLGRVTGVEPSESAVEYCRRHRALEVVHAAVEALPFDDSSFDVVMALDVLEHVTEDTRALRELRRVTRPGGMLLATVPAYRLLWSQHDESHHHQRRYTRPLLISRARSAGWQPRRATYFNSILLPPIAAVRVFRRHPEATGKSDYQLTPGVMNRVLEQPLRLEAAAIRRGVNLPAGVSIGMLARA